MFKLLLAEDDSEIRLMLQRWLTKNGYSVTVVTNGKEALDVMAKDDARNGRVRVCPFASRWRRYYARFDDNG